MLCFNTIFVAQPPLCQVFIIRAKLTHFLNVDYFKG